MTKPQIESIDTYGTNAPKAARFGEGATDIAGVREATNARTNLSNRQSTTPVSIDKLITKR